MKNKQTLIIIAVAVVLAILWSISMFNGLVTKEEAVVHHTMAHMGTSTVDTTAFSVYDGASGYNVTRTFSRYGDSVSSSVNTVAAISRTYPCSKSKRRAEVVISVIIGSWKYDLMKK